MDYVKGFDERIMVAQPFFPEVLGRVLGGDLENYGIGLPADYVIRETLKGCYDLMEDAENESPHIADPYYDEPPIMLFTDNNDILYAEILLGIKKKKAYGNNDKTILFASNGEFREKYLTDEERELLYKDYTRVKVVPGFSGLDVNCAYGKNSNVICISWVLVSNAINGFMYYKKKDPSRFGGWWSLFYGIGHERGHSLFKSETENIHPVLHGSGTKADDLGNIAASKGEDPEYIERFFSFLNLK